MFRKCFLTVVVALLLGAGGCASKWEEATDDVLAAFTEFTDRIAAIRTKQDIAAAKPELDALGQRIQRGMEVAVAEQARTPEADGMSVNYYQPRFLEVGKRTKSELERIRRELGQAAEADVRWAMGPGMARMLK